MIIPHGDGDLALFYILIGISLICVLFIYAYVISRIQSQRFKHKMMVCQSQLENNKETENHLRQELTLLKDKLIHVMEDPVTNLVGWQLFEDRLKQTILDSARYQLTMGVLMVDIDDFEMINHALDFKVGDELLQEVAKRLQSCIRRVDCVSRLNKATFVILLSQLNKPEAAAIVAQRVMQAIEQPIKLKEHELYITACMGIAIFPADGQDPASLLRNSEYALRLAKEKGKQVYQFYHENIQTNSHRELALITGLRSESIVQEFKIYYQPVFHAENKNIICMEAILYWQHPSLGLIGPDELFNYAEKQNKLHVITEWLLQNACQQFLHWRTLNATPELLGIPLPLKLLESSHFVYRISKTIQDLQVKPEWLLLEIQVNPGATSFDLIEKALNMLRYVKVQLAVDAFGTGLVSLLDLKKLIVNYLKLEPALIKDIENNPRTAELIKSVLFLAKSLSMQLVVQGVKTEKQFTILQELGCTLMKGPLFGEPLSEKEVAKKMAVSEPQNI